MPRLFWRGRVALQRLPGTLIGSMLSTAFWLKLLRPNWSDGEAPSTSSYILKLLALAGFDMVKDPDWMVMSLFDRQVNNLAGGHGQLSCRFKMPIR
jgi:hypothetical protein